jgi:hypothetical protein
MDALERLDMFVDRVGELNTARRLGREGIDASLGIEFDVPGGGVRITESPPDEDDLRSYLTTLRQLVMNENDPVFVNAISKLAARHITDAAVRDALKHGRREWEKHKADRSMQLNELSEAEVFELYINGRVFHADQAAESRLREVMATPESAALARSFISAYATEAARYVTWVAAVIRAAKADGVLQAVPVFGGTR